MFPVNTLWYFNDSTAAYWISAAVRLILYSPHTTVTSELFAWYLSLLSILVIEIIDDFTLYTSSNVLTVFLHLMQINSRKHKYLLPTNFRIGVRQGRCQCLDLQRVICNVNKKYRQNIIRRTSYICLSNNTMWVLLYK